MALKFRKRQKDMFIVPVQMDGVDAGNAQDLQDPSMSLMETRHQVAPGIQAARSLDGCGGGVPVSVLAKMNRRCSKPPFCRLSPSRASVFALIRSQQEFGVCIKRVEAFSAYA